MASQPTYSCVLINALLQLTVAAWKFCWKKTIQSRRFSQHYQILALRISAADDITDIGIVLAKHCNLISCSFVLHIDWLKPFLTDHAIPCGINGLTNFICLLWWNAMIVTIEKKCVSIIRYPLLRNKGSQFDCGYLQTAQEYFIWKQITFITGCPLATGGSGQLVS